MTDQDVFPFGLTEESFLHLWHSSLLPRPQIIADLILKSFPFAIPQDRPALVSLLVAQLIEASLRLVAVENALTDRTKSVAHNLTGQPTMGLGYLSLQTAQCGTCGAEPSGGGDAKASSKPKSQSF